MERRGKRHDGGTSRQCPICFGVGARVPYNFIGGKVVYAHRRCIGIEAKQPPKPVEKYQWLTTVTNPLRPATGFDAGVTGWKLHAVECRPDANEKDLKGFKALCGLRPIYGWGADLFVEDECLKCSAVIERHERVSRISLPNDPATHTNPFKSARHRSAP